MARLHVRVFGKLRLSNGEATVERFPTRRVEELLGYLLLNNNRRQSREKLIGVLWPDASPGKGRASLSTALWRLGNVFQQVQLPLNTFVQSSRDWLCFQSDEPVDVDLFQFERRLDQAEATTDSQTLEDKYRQAASLYAGAFCDGIYSEWCLLERERLERRYLRGLGQLIASLIARGEYGEATHWSQVILRRDPLREEVHRALMYCYWQLGRRAEGVRQFVICARLLQRELHIPPMPETIDLYRRMVETGLEELESDSPSPLVHRTQLRSAFNDFLDAAERLALLLEPSPVEREKIIVP